MVRIIVLLIHDLGQSKVCYLDLTAHVALGQEDVAGLQVVVDNRRLDLVQVLECRHHLHHYGPGLALRYCFMLEIWIHFFSIFLISNDSQYNRKNYTQVTKYKYAIQYSFYLACYFFLHIISIISIAFDFY